MRRAAVVGCALLLVACAGARARDGAFGQVEALFRDVKQDAQAYGASLDPEPRAVVLERVRLAEQAIGTTSRRIMADQPWDLILEDADRGIQVMLADGEIGPSGAQIARDGHQVFGELINLYLWGQK